MHTRRHTVILEISSIKGEIEMIISASRRTDIPAFYSDWFLNRIREGEMLVPNIFNENHLSRVIINPQNVECIVFWTKNPEPMLARLPELDESGFSYYFQYTLTGFGKDIERFIPEQKRRIETFQKLSEKLGALRVDWRFDPIMLSSKYDIQWMAEEFEKLCMELAPYTRRCMISFVDYYKRRDFSFRELTKQEMHEVAGKLSEIAEKYCLPLYTCAEKIDLSQYGIAHGACIDQHKIEQVIGCKVDIKKDRMQRADCGCMESIDIGMYDTCMNGCTYCYANTNMQTVQGCYQRHDPNSPMLIGYPTGKETVTVRNMKSARMPQMSLFDYLESR